MANQTVFCFVLRKCCLHENEIYKIQVYNKSTSISTFAVQVLPNLQKSSGRLLREVCHPYTALFRNNANFFLQTQENNQDEERETGCFQSKINYVNTKTRAKTKYQISGGQNSYSSSFPLLDQKFESSLIDS